MVNVVVIEVYMVSKVEVVFLWRRNLVFLVLVLEASADDEDDGDD